MRKRLEKRNVTLTFLGAEAKEHPSGINYYKGMEIPEKHWEYCLRSGAELSEIEEEKVVAEEKKPVPKKKVAVKAKKAPSKRKPSTS